MLGPAPYRPFGADRMEPLPVYATWWGEVGRCVGSGSADFGRIRWFSVPGQAFDTPDHGLALGRWVPPHDVYLAEERIDSEDVVKHEMVHDRLHGGDADDPRFLLCSGIGH